MQISKLCSYISHKGINEGRIVLHSDLNNFFASAECNEDHSLRNVPLAVCGNEEDRHGIVLAKNYIAKKYGIKTGQAIWQAKKLCPSLLCIYPNYSLYVKYSRLVRKIYADYSSRIESFGIDEAWIDLSGNVGVKSIYDGERIANEIRERVKSEIGLTVSVGVSDNKAFAKLASDFKKPDAVTVFCPDNYMDTVYKISASELLYIGRRTYEKLTKYGIRTIGDLAESDEIFLKSVFGKCGEIFHNFACGFDNASVECVSVEREIKSIGNSTTPMRSMESFEDVKLICYMLCEEVAYRLRASSLMGRTLALVIRDDTLSWIERFSPLPELTDSSFMIAETALSLFKKVYKSDIAIRSLGIRVTNLSPARSCVQYSLYDDIMKSRRRRALEGVADSLKNRFGKSIIQRAVVMTDPKLFNYKEGHSESINFIKC